MVANPPKKRLSHPQQQDTVAIAKAAQKAVAEATAAVEDLKKKLKEEAGRFKELEIAKKRLEKGE
jgi:hypothetical protein